MVKIPFLYESLQKRSPRVFIKKGNWKVTSSVREVTFHSHSGPFASNENGTLLIEEDTVMFCEVPGTQPATVYLMSI